MSSIKIYPPNTLPAEGISDTQFQIWTENLEIYLEIESKFRKFLHDGKYSTWTPAEQNEKRILTVIEPDKEEQLPDIRRDLRQFINIVAKYVHVDYYQPIVRHSSSLKWIYNKIREDYDILQQGIHFFNLLDLTWDPAGDVTPIGFYNNYRSLIIGNLAKKSTVIQWKGETMKEDERLSPSHEDLILLNVLQLIHPKLPTFIREQYAHKMGLDRRLMDFKTEILTKAKHYIQEIETPQAANIETNEDLQCNYSSTQQPRNFGRSNWKSQNYQRRPQQSNYQRQPQQSNYQKPTTSFQSSGQPPPFCRICQVSGLSRTIYTSHYLGEATCPSLSSKDKQLLTSRITQQLGAVSLDDNEEDSIAKEYGDDQEDLQQLQQQQQVNHCKIKKNNNDINDEQNTFDNDSNDNGNMSNSDFSMTTCNFIQPIPTQTLTVQDQNNQDIHLDLDTGATVSYVKLSAVKSHGFKIRPNSQLSNLADGKTKMKAIGEIDEIFYRNSWQVRFHAIVTQNLHCNFVAGNNFIKENSIIQDLNAKTISVHKKYTVAETSKSLILPTAPNNLLLQNNHLNVILPGQDIPLSVPYQDSTQLAIQPWYQNKQITWPQPQICSVKNGIISIKNHLNEPIHVKNQTKIQIRTLSQAVDNPSIIPTNTAREVFKDRDNTHLIEINNEDIDPAIVRYVKDINHTFKDVFNEDLTTGYNHRFGKHIAKLNWASSTKPTANKIQNINYDHATKELLQEVCDDLTEKNVLGIPQEHDVIIQYCSPSFLVRKQKAKNKSKQDLTKDDVRLVVNFSKINDYLKNMPTSITKPKDIFSQLGQWNYIIVMDLCSGFFQNHISTDDAIWLGITTPFRGMRFLKRSGQGLIGQSEELDELLCKVLGQEMKEKKVARIADDIYIGGNDQKETADNYKRVLQKLQAANLKISASKTKVFLKSVDILGWKWKQGGFLSPSPHRVNALKNTKQTDIKNVKDLRSYLGLYKTLLPASPNLTILLNPFDLEVADRDSKEEIVWNRDLIKHFQEATEAVDKLQTIYLPHPDDQLLIEVDAAKVNPGIGHTVYAIKDGVKLPVAFHSVKLSPNHAKWMACELEALAFSTAINAEFDTLKECSKPVIISPDSKPVADAIKLVKKGQYSASPRIQSFINNINRLPIIVQLASGKANQNASSDYQSRHPSICTSEYCSICTFVSETSDAVLLPTLAAINNANEIDGMNNKNAWKKIQDQQKACREAKYLLKSGKTPNKLTGKINSEIRRLCTVAKLNKDNLLIVESQPNKYSTIRSELIVIPQTHLPALLCQLHNSQQHPSKSQLKAQFDKLYYSVGLMAAIEKLYDECFFCSTQKKIPSIAKHATATDTVVPGTHFHADVIRRQSQYIFTIRDHFSSYTSAKIIKNETHQELKRAIIDTVITLKLSGECTIKVDNATGFSPLVNNKDPDLAKLQINIVKSDVFNKNENAVIDKACYEIEQELKRIEPDGRPISNTTLQIAVTHLNNKLRRNGQISAYEIHFNRDMHTGKNLNLNYDKIREEQINVRKVHNSKYNDKLANDKSNPQPGDIVIVRDKPDKHKANDVFLVSNSQDDKVTMQKIIHPHTSQPKMRAKEYITHKDRLYVAKHSNTIKFPVPSTSQKSFKPSWNPIRKIDNDEEEDDGIVDHSVQENIVPEFTSPVRIRIQSPQKKTPLNQDLDQRIERQRKAAAEQLKQTISRQNRVVTEPVPPRRSSVRKESAEATKKIQALGNPKKRHNSLLIVEENDVLYQQQQQQQQEQHRRHSSTNDQLIDISDNLSQISNDSSEQWDYTDIVEHPDPDEIFHECNLDNSFMHPPLNLSSVSNTVEPGRVYTYNSILDRIPPIVPAPTAGPSRKKSSSLKKGDANQ